MSTVQISRPSNAIERARAAYEEAMQRKRQAEAERRSRDRTRNISVGVVLCAVISVFIGLSIQQGWLSNSSPSLSASTSSRDNSTKKFVATRTGKVRTPIEGNTCRELDFNNEIGRFVAEGVAPCEEVRRLPSESKRSAEERFRYIRENFMR